jgi:Beta-lactamase enzyme family
VITLPFIPEPPPALVQPVITIPRGREASFGTIIGRVGGSTTRIVVRVDGVTKADVALEPDLTSSYLPPQPYRIRVSLPPRDVTIRVIAYDSLGNSKARRVGPVFGLPRAGRPVPIRSILDAALARRVRELIRAYPGPAAVYVQDLRTGRGAAWNARARFQAASTVKLGIALEVLRVLRHKPAPGTRLATLFRRMLVYSSNRAANDLEVWLGGSTTAGAARVNATLQALHLTDSHINGGYIIGTASERPIPLRVETQPPYFTFGKYTSSWDLARLHRLFHRASSGHGPLLRLPGHFTAADARYLLYTLAHIRDTGKIDRYIGDNPGVSVLHKAGWIFHARHDSALVFWRRGAFVVTVMTWNWGLAGASSDILAGKVARAALRRFSDRTVTRPDLHAWRIRF